MTLDNGVIEAVNSLSGEKPEIVVYVKIARVIVPDIRTVLTPTILETELGFLKELILKKIAYTDLVVERLIVATCEVREQLDMVTPDVVLTQTAVEEVSQEPVVSVGRVIFKTSLLLKKKPEGSETVPLIKVLIPTIFVEASML